LPDIPFAGNAVIPASLIRALVTKPFLCHEINDGKCGAIYSNGKNPLQLAQTGHRKFYGDMKTLIVLRIIATISGLGVLTGVILKLRPIPVPVFLLVGFSATSFIVGIVSYMISEKERGKEKRTHALSRKTAIIGSLTTLALVIGTHPVLACSFIGPVPSVLYVNLPFIWRDGDVYPAPDDQRAVVSPAEMRDDSCL